MSDVQTICATVARCVGMHSVCCLAFVGAVSGAIRRHKFTDVEKTVKVKVEQCGN